MERDPAVAHVYAQALVGAARQTGVTDQVFEQAEPLHRCFRKGSKLRLFLEAPQIRDDKKHEVIDNVFRGRIEPLLLNLIHVMLRNNRIENLDETLRLICELVEEYRGIVPAAVTTAVELSDAQRARLRQNLEQRLGLRFDIRFRVDARILGGAVFKYRDRMIDGSVKFDLQKLRERLQATALADTEEGYWSLGL
jgi:F-type H+-transporting ATPase subunit delta